jgi:hypothetical protein
LVRSARCKHKLCVADTLLVDFRKGDVGLSGELRSGCKHGFRMSSEDFANCWYRNDVTVTERLALMALIFPANGDSHHNMTHMSEDSAQSVWLTALQVCEALTNADISPRFVKHETKRITFDLYRLATGLGRAAEHLSRPNCKVAKMCYRCR